MSCQPRPQPQASGTAAISASSGTATNTPTRTRSKTLVRSGMISGLAAVREVGSPVRAAVASVVVVMRSSLAGRGTSHGHLLRIDQGPGPTRLNLRSRSLRYRRFPCRGLLGWPAGTSGRVGRAPETGPRAAAEAAAGIGTDGDNGMNSGNGAVNDYGASAVIHGRVSADQERGRSAERLKRSWPRRNMPRPQEPEGFQRLLLTARR